MALPTRNKTDNQEIGILEKIVAEERYWAKLQSDMASPTKVKPEKQEIADLEDIVKRWAWYSFDVTKTKEHAKIPKEFLHMAVNWKHVKFHFDTPNYNIQPMRPHEHTKISTQPQTLFKTFYRNDTDREQEYTFNTQRVTRSSCTVALERGVTTGGEFCLKLSPPGDIIEANAGFKREISIFNVHEDTVEEELIWGVDSLLHVPPRTETSAELVITEAQCGGSFHMEIRFHGRVIVCLNNMADNNSLVSVIEGDIADIMLREIKNGLKDFRVDRRVVVADIRGRCHFKYGIEQRVKIEEKLLNEVLPPE